MQVKPYALLTLRLTGQIHHVSTGNWNVRAERCLPPLHRTPQPPQKDKQVLPPLAEKCPKVPLPKECHLGQRETSKIIKSNCQPITTMPAKPCPEMPHLHSYWTPPGMGTPSLLHVFQCFTILSVKKFFPISNLNLNLPWRNLRP